MTTINPLFNENLAAEYLGGCETPISVRTMQRWRLEGYGPCYVKLGRLVRYLKSDLDEFIQSSRLVSTSMQTQWGE